MQHSLAVKTDDIDFLGVEVVAVDKGSHRGGVAGGDHRLGRGQRAGPGGAVREARGVGDGLAQQGAILVCIGQEARAAKGDGRLAVGLDQGDVDPVHRGAAHEANGGGGHFNRLSICRAP